MTSSITDSLETKGPRYQLSWTVAAYKAPITVIVSEQAFLDSILTRVKISETGRQVGIQVDRTTY